MRRGAIAGLGAYAFGIVALVVIRYPALFEALSFREYVREAPPPAQLILPTMIFGTAPARSAATSVYRGSVERTGVSNERVPTPLVTEWCYRPLNVGVHGASKATPAVDASGVYVGTDSGYFLALDARGKLRWSVYLPDSARGIHATAVLDADTVYIGAYNGVVYAIDKATGALRWTKKVGDSIGASAVLHEGSLYFSVETNHPDGYLIKLDARDGTLKWVSAWLEEQSHSSPTLAPEFDTVMVGSNSGLFRAFAMSDGSLKWSRTLLDAMKGTALVLRETVIFSSWEKRTLALDIATGTQMWSYAMSGASQVSPTLAPRSNVVMVGDGTGLLTALDPRDGTKAWEHSAQITRYQVSGLTTTSNEDREIFWSLCRAQTLCAMDPKSGRLISETDLPTNFSGAPVAFDGALYLALDGIDGGLCKLVGAR